MKCVDITRIFAEQKMQEANEKADAARLSKARLEFKKRLDEVEMRNEEEAL
jgi:hypothetical protein